MFTLITNVNNNMVYNQNSIEEYLESKQIKKKKNGITLGTEKEKKKYTHAH